MSSGGSGGSGSGYPDAEVFEVTDEQCYQDPFACCSNHYLEDGCKARKDADGDSMCFFAKPDDSSFGYCGGALCDETKTLGKTEKDCAHVSGCQWTKVESVAGGSCNFYDKCQAQNATQCGALTGCVYGHEKEEGGSEGDAATECMEMYCTAKHSTCKADAECLKFLTGDT